MKNLKNSSTATESFFEKVGRLTKLQKIFICCGALLVLIGAFTYFSYMPKFKKIGQLNEKSKNLNRELSAVKSKAVHLKKYQKEMKAAEVQFNVVMQALPEKEDIPKLLADISKSGKDAGLEFLLFKPEPEVIKEFYAEIPVSMEVAGTYHDVAVFFDKVARLSRVVNIKNIKIERPKEGTALNTGCTAVTYKFVENSPKGKGEKGKNSKKNKTT